MSSCVCKKLFKSVQVCSGCCEMFRGLTFLGHSVVSLLTVTECRNDMQVVLRTSGINGYSLNYSLNYWTEYSTPKLLVSGSPNYKKLCYRAELVGF